MFFNFVNLILKSKETEVFKPIKQDYQDHQLDVPYGPKLVEVPDQEDIPSQELITSLTSGEPKKKIVLYFNNSHI